MKLRFLKSAVVGGVIVGPGNVEIIEVSEEEAAFWIEQKVAEEVTEKPTKNSAK